MLMLFPDNAHFIFQLRFQGTKTKPAVSACIDDLVIAYGIAETFVYKKRGVIKQVVGGDDIQVRNFLSDPLSQAAALGFLLGKDQGDIFQIIR